MTFRSKLKIVANLVAVSAAALTLQSQALATSYVFSGDRQITKLVVGAKVAFTLDGASLRPAGCDNGNRMGLWDTNSNYDAKVSSIISAYLSGQTINVSFDYDETGCEATVSYFIVTPTP